MRAEITEMAWPERSMEEALGLDLRYMVTAIYFLVGFERLTGHEFEQLTEMGLLDRGGRPTVTRRQAGCIGFWLGDMLNCEARVTVSDSRMTLLQCAAPEWAVERLRRLSWTVGGQDER